MSRRGELAQLVAAGKRSEATLDFFDEKAARLTSFFNHEKDQAGHPLPCTCEEGNCLTRRPLKLSELQPPHGAELVDQHIGWRRLTVSDHSIGKELSVLRSVLKLAKRHGKFAGDLDEVLPIDFETGYKPIERWLPIAEVDGLVTQLHRESPDQGARVAFSLATGAEWAATENVLDSDVGMEMVHLPGTKNETRDRTVPIVLPWQAELLEFALRHARGTEGKLFAPWSNRNRDIKLACERAGIPPCSPNDLRRTFATWLRAEGYAPHDIAVMMGHVDSRMVERIYGRLNPEQLSAIMQRAAPGSAKLGQHGPAVPVMPDDDSKKLKVLAPRARFERATHGLTVRSILSLTCSGACEIPWLLMRGVVRMAGRPVAAQLRSA